MAGLPIYRQTSLFERHFKGKHQSFSSEDDSCSDNGSEEEDSSSCQSIRSDDHLKSKKDYDGSNQLFIGLLGLDLEESKGKKVHYHKQEERYFEDNKVKSSKTKNGQSNFKSKKGIQVEGYRRSSLMRDFCYFRSEQESQFLQMQNESLIAWRKFQNATVSESKDIRSNKNNRSSTYFRQQIYIKAPSSNVFSLRDLQVAQGQKIEEDFPHVMQVRSALRRKSCTCKECGVLDSKQIKTKDVRYVPTQHRQFKDNNNSNNYGSNNNTNKRISNMLVTPRNYSQRNSSSFLDPSRNNYQINEGPSSSQFIPSESIISRVSNSIPGSLACLGDQSIDRGKIINQNIIQKTPPRKVSQSYSSNNNTKPSKVQASQKDTLRQNKQYQTENNVANHHRILKYSQDFQNGNVSLPKIDVQSDSGQFQMNKRINSNINNLLESTLNEKTNSDNRLSLLSKKLSENSNESTQNQHETSIHQKKVIVNKQQQGQVKTGGYGSQRQIIEEYTSHKIGKKLDFQNEQEDGQILNQNQTTSRGQGIHNDIIHHVSIESLMHFRDRYLKEFQDKKKKAAKKGNIISIESSRLQENQNNHNEQPIKAKIQRELSPIRSLKDELMLAGKIQIFENGSKQQEIQSKQKESALKQQLKEEEDSKQQLIDNIKVFSKNQSRFSLSSQYKRQGDTKQDHITEKNSFTNQINSFQKLFQTTGTRSSGSTIKGKLTKRELLLSFPAEINNHQIQLSTSTSIKKNNTSKPKTLIIQRNSQDFNQTKQISSNQVVSLLTSSDDTTTTTTAGSAIPFHSQGVIQYKTPHIVVEHHQRKNASLSDFPNGSKNLFNKFSCYYQSVSKNNSGIINKTSSVPMFSTSVQKMDGQDQIGRNKQKQNTSIVRSIVWQ